MHRILNGFLIGVVLVAFTQSPLSAAQALTEIGRLPIALVYKGPGSCEENCSEAAADIAIAAGFKAVFVAPDALNANSTTEQVQELFGKAALWMQPGGISNEAYYTMTPRMRTELKEFVRNGGGYVGFCAGAFMTTRKIGGTRDAGLGIFPGGTNLFRRYAATPRVTFSFEKLNWLGSNRTVYFEGGPFIYGIENNPAVEVIAYYETGNVAAARTTFGNGRVFITGAHPEAPLDWAEEDGLHMPENTHDLAESMVKWAGYR